MKLILVWILIPWKTVSKGIKKFIDKDKIILIITHYRKILDYIETDKIILMENGEISAEGEMELINKIEEKGFSNVTNGN